MWPEEGTRKDGLFSTFQTIKSEVLRFVNGQRKFRLWTYEELAAMSGTEVEDWKCDGWIRRMMYGRTGRQWLREDHYLWWTTEKTHHSGLLFTADCRTGAEWLRKDAANDVHAIGLMVEEAMDSAERPQPTFRGHFHKIKSGARRIIDGGSRMKQLGNGQYLQQLGIQNRCRGCGVPCDLDRFLCRHCQKNGNGKN